MAYTGSNDLTGIRNCGGEQRLPNNYRGAGVVSGVTKIGGTAAPCRVFLHADDSTLLSYMRTGPTGVYSFVGLGAGAYYLIIKDDQNTLYRAKVEHVAVP